MNAEVSKPIYKRVLLKLSGESIATKEGSGIDYAALAQMVKRIKSLMDLGVDVAIVMGGGNFLRGASLSAQGFDRVTADHMGMMFTVVNGLALRAELQKIGVNVSLTSSLEIPGVVKKYYRDDALADIRSGRVLIFTGGVGTPLFSTDSAASLRAIEIGADIILKASTVDGVYSADPKKDAKATKFDRLGYQDVIEKNLQVMDLAAICLCQEHSMPIRVFDMTKPTILNDIVLGSCDGTFIGGEKHA